MEIKISKAQEEVWEWKEKLYEEVKNLSGTDRISYLLDKTHATMERLKALRVKKIK